MMFRRVGGLAAVAVATMFWMACGEVYRPVVIPINITPPNSANFHAVFALSANVPGNPGSAQQIDVSGDSNIGAETMGVNPTHAAVLPNGSRVFVANSAGNPCTGVDFISSFSPATQSSTATGLGSAIIFSLPNVSSGQTSSSTITGISEAGNLVTVTLSAPLANAVAGASIVISNVTTSGSNAFAYNGCFPIVSVSGTTITYTASVAGLAPGTGGAANIPSFCPYFPDYVTTTQATAVYVANYGADGNPNCNLASTDSVASLDPFSNTITNLGYLPAGSHPVAMAETPDALNLYVANQGTNTVADLSPIDLSTRATIPVGATPIWAVSRADGQRVYVLSQGSGTLAVIDTVSNTVLPSQTNLNIGAGANFILYDAKLNRLYVTNPGIPNAASAAVYVYSATGGTDLTGTANDTPLLLTTISMAPGSAACPGGCSPVSVAALPDGSRFYVASYRSEANCADPSIGASFACMVPRLTEYDALSMKLKPAASTLLSPSMSLLMAPQFGASQYAVRSVASCVPPATYAPAPGATRFRMFATAAADSSHVYVSICDAGVIADISTTTSSIAASAPNNTPDVLVADIPTPFSAGAPGANGEPGTQNPVFLLMGP